jgi:hypothetical protein
MLSELVLSVTRDHTKFIYIFIAMPALAHSVCLILFIESAIELLGEILIKMN